MKVLMTTDAVGGVWTYATELATGLRERGADVTLAVLGPPPGDEQRAGHDVVHAHAGRLEWQDDPWDDVEEAGRRLIDLAADVEPDVVHLNGYAHAALPWRAGVLVVAHSDVLSWWDAVRGEPAPPSWDRYRDAVQAGLAAADAVVAPTADVLASLRRHYGIGARGRVIPNGVRDDFPPLPKEPVVLAAGRLWDEAKALDTLISAAPRVGWPVEVAGDGGGAATAVRPLGRLAPAALRERMQAAAIFAHPARYEPFGLAPLEAGLAGCALVLGDIASLREVWGDAATYVPPGDGDALAAQIQRLIDDPPLRDRFGDRARRRALSYGVPGMTDAYLDAYGRTPAGRAVGA